MYELPKDEVENESYTFNDAWGEVVMQGGWSNSEIDEKIARITDEFMRLYQKGD